MLNVYKFEVAGYEDFSKFLFRGGDIIERLLGNYCKVVYKIHSFKSKGVITGEVLDINKADFILIKDQNGMHYIHKSAIISIKPREKLVVE